MTIPAEQESHFIVLTEDQTKVLLDTIKVVIDHKANITHLGHTAMLLALLRNVSGQTSQLSPSYGSSICSPCWINGRRYLRPFGSQPTPTKSYIPICQSFAPVTINVQDLTLSSKATSAEIRDKVISVSKIAQDQYRTINKRESLMPESVDVMEYLGNLMYKSHRKSQAVFPSQQPIQQLTADPVSPDSYITITITPSLSRVVLPQ
jgi:15-O-acetyltransferase Tri3